MSYYSQLFILERTKGTKVFLDQAELLIQILILLYQSICSEMVFHLHPAIQPPPHDGPHFPLITLWDNVACQHRLLTEHLGVKRIALVTGWSMAGCQAYQWGAQFPDMVNAILPFCSSAKTSPHNFVFLEGVKSALCADQNWMDGHYSSPPIKGLMAFARVYAGWAFSQTFYREETV